MQRSLGGESGFSVVDMIAVSAMLGVIFAIAIPTLTGSVDRMRLGQSAREVERELQSAKQRALGKGRPMRVRFNCPVAGQYRSVELIGLPSVPAAADSALNRCNATTYPFPAPDQNPLTLPNLDGPVRTLDPSVQFGVVRTIEFWPDGTAHYDTGVNPWPMIPPTGVTLTLTRSGKTSTITVNGIGKISLQ